MKNMKESLKIKVLTTIKNSRLVPTSRWYFVSKNYFFWLLFFTSIMIGSLAFSSILFNLIIETSPMVSATHFTYPMFFLNHIPIIWLFFVILFSVSAWFNLRRVNGGHRTSHVLGFFTSILFSLLIGILLFISGLSEKIEESIRNTIPIYRIIVEQKLDKKAQYLNEQGLSAQSIRIERERLRTKCILERSGNCF